RDRPLWQPLRSREEDRGLAGRHRLDRWHHRAAAGRRDRRLEVGAAVDRVGGCAERSLGPLVREVVLEVRRDLLLLQGRKLLLDLTLDLRQRLGAGRVIGLDLDQVPAALALERPDELLYRRR